MIYTLAFLVNLVFGIVLSVVFCTANPFIMDFLHVSPQMRPYSMIYIYIVGGGGFLTAVFNVMLQIPYIQSLSDDPSFVSSLKAAGAYIFPLIMGIICNWGLGLTTGYTVGVLLGLGVAGIYAGTATDECIRGLIVMYYWYKKKWLGKSVVDRNDIVMTEEK